MKKESSISIRKTLYYHKIIYILSKEKPSIRDFATLSVIYSKIQTLNDEKFERTETKRLLNYAQRNPQYTRIIMDIINKHRKTEQKNTNNKTISDIYSEVHSLVAHTAEILNGTVISETKVKECYSRIQFKISELTSMVHSLNDLDYKHLMELLNESMKQCEKTIAYCQAENNIWTKQNNSL